MNKRFVSEETVVSCQCERETLKFGTKQVDIKVSSLHLEEITKMKF